MTNGPIDRIRIAAPCPASWEEMAGDERTRHCTLCDLNVYNFAAMTRDEVNELLARTEGRVCARLYRRADGTVLTRDCPTGLRALRRRASRAAAVLVTALLSVPALAFGGATCKKPRIKGSKVELTVERVATPQPAVFTGVVLSGGSALPGVTVTVLNEANARTVTAITDGQGAFNFASLSDGLYRIDVQLAGFTPTSIQHLELKSSGVTHASFVMEASTVETIVVGALAPLLDPRSTSITTTITRTELERLPF